ncbi:MAG: rRNA maturation RNase YbeY [Ignavibacteriae bacterium]|nr:rRNA maturation RNase YbeY [Ignavibacteria bacterium]MBI3364858.1 rRNA maturation RNase YbeY [Ignavibacteriota bacterium]
MIRIHAFNAHPKHRIRHREIIPLVRGVLKGEHRTWADMNIVFVADKRMRALNGQYLQHRYTTDVLSFQLTEPQSKTLEGEVYVNLDQARRQARLYNVTLQCEVARLIVHGILHVVGYDDKTKRQKDRMTRMENQYLLRMNYIQEGVGRENG